MPPNYLLFDLPIKNVSMSDAVDDCLNALDSNTYLSVFFINAHCVNLSFQDPEYRTILKHNSHNYADGIGMRLASKLFKKPLLDNVNGTDMFPRLCSALNQTRHRVFLLGGTMDTLKKLTYQIHQQYPNIVICGTHHGYFLENENEPIATIIQHSQADLLLVALGVPKQEKWIDHYAKTTEVKVAMGVGGLFNFYSGNIPRAPLWMRKAGIEWFHRFCMEPSRLWKRYFIGNTVFMIRAVYWSFKKKKQ